MKLVNVIFMLTMLLASTYGIAHSKATTSMPEDGDVLSQSPEVLVLTVSGKSRLLRLELTNEDNQSIDIDFQPITKPTKVFEVPMPVLAPGRYHAKWVIMGRDTHKVIHDMEFSIMMDHK